jgi:multiple sugar transport system substrate-binding protein
MTFPDGSHDAEPAGGVNPNLSRRQLLTGAAAISVGALVGSTPAFARRAVFARSVMADESTVEGRALAGLKKLIADKKLKSGTTFTVMIPGGSQTNVVPSFEQFEKLTGIKVKTIQVGDLGQIHTKAIQEATAKTGTPDGILHMANWNGDFADAGLIVPLDEWVQKYNPQMNDPRVGYAQPLGGFTTKYRNRVWALDHDDDSFTYFYRSDLFTNAKLKAQFEDKYGFALKPPDTWDQFDKIAAFFTRPDQYYGAFLFANRAFAYVNWAARFFSRGGIYMDRDMVPQIASDFGVSALEELVPVTQKYMPKEAVTGDWTALYQAFPAGKVVQATSWISLGKFANDPKNSKIPGYGRAAVMPGSMVKGRLFRAAPHVVGWTWSMNRYGKNPEAMYLICQWLTGPTEGAKTVARVGILDAYRRNHFSDPAVIKAYGGKGVTVPLLGCTKIAFPDIGIRGGTEYLDVLNSNLQDAYAGRKKPEDALKSAAKSWNKITDRIGREGQTDAWRAELKLYPATLKAAWKLVGQKV